MPYIRVWVHYVWAVKYRAPILTDAFRYPLFEHIRQNALEKGIYLNRINGYHDHVHCLVSLGTTQSIDKTVQLLKGESSFWFNRKSGFKTTKLEWQDDYFAISVSESVLPAVQAYIDNQEVHHRKRTFAEEYNEFISRYGFAIQSN